MDTKVTLRQFLEITKKVVEPDLCAVYVDVYDEDFEQYFPERVKFGNYDCPGNIKNLNQYLDYEIYGFEQHFQFGELEEQTMWLREIK